jgi:hypothetical protein
MQVSRPSHRRRFIVSIYLADEAIEFPHNDRLTIPLTRLFGGTCYGEDARRAAARAWVKYVGRYRYEKLAALNCPRLIAMAETEPSRVALRLTESALCPRGAGFVLDNGAEAWLIGVRAA